MNQYKNEFEQVTKNYQNVLSNLASGLFGDKQQAPPAEVLSFGTSWLYAAYKTKARHVAAIPHIITKGRGKKPVELDIDMDLRDLVERVHMSTFSIYGYSYLLKLKSRGGRLLGVRWLDPTQVSYDLDHRTNQLLGFRYNGLFYPVDKRGNCDIVYFWLPTLRDIGPGLPTSSVLEHSATALRYSTIMLSLFYQQGGMPLTIVPLPNGVGREEGERIEGRLQRMMAGVRNAFRFVVLNREIVPQRLGANPNELDYSPIRKELLAEICAVTGVPQFILTGENTGGLGSDSTAHQARLLFTQNFIAERLWIDNILNRQLFNEIDHTLTSEPNKLEIVQEAQLLQVQAVNTAVGQPVMTVDEGREFLGLPPLPKQEMESPQEELPQEEDDDTPEDDPAAEERKTLRNWIAKRIKKSKPLNGFVPSQLKKSEVFNAVYHATVKQLQNMEHLDNPEAVDILEQFQVEMLALSSLLQNGRMSLEEYEDRFKRLIDLTLKRLFSVGAGEDYDNLPQPAQTTIVDMSQEQQDYSGAIALALASGEYEDNPAGLSNRIALWVSILGGALFLGRMWGDDNKRLEWRLGGTVEHCTTCSTLNGQVKTAKEWRESGYQPQGSMLECKGFRCQCGLYEV